MIEIELKLNGKYAFEYTTNAIPRVCDFLNISHDDISGEFKVKKVTHRVFQEKRDKNIISYVTVEAEGVNA